MPVLHALQSQSHHIHHMGMSRNRSISWKKQQHHPGAVHSKSGWAQHRSHPCFPSQLYQGTQKHRWVHFLKLQDETGSYCSTFHTESIICKETGHTKKLSPWPCCWHRGAPGAQGTHPQPGFGRLLGSLMPDQGTHVQTHLLQSNIILKWAKLTIHFHFLFFFSTVSYSVIEDPALQAAGIHTACSLHLVNNINIS